MLTKLKNKTKNIKGEFGNPGLLLVTDPTYSQTAFTLVIYS